MEFPIEGVREGLYRYAMAEIWIPNKSVMNPFLKRVDI